MVDITNISNVTQELVVQHSQKKKKINELNHIITRGRRIQSGQSNQSNSVQHDQYSLAKNQNQNKECGLQQIVSSCQDNGVGRTLSLDCAQTDKFNAASYIHKLPQQSPHSKYVQHLTEQTIDKENLATQSYTNDSYDLQSISNVNKKGSVQRRLLSHNSQANDKIFFKQPNNYIDRFSLLQQEYSYDDAKEFQKHISNDISSTQQCQFRQVPHQLQQQVLHVAVGGGRTTRRHRHPESASQSSLAKKPKSLNNERSYFFPQINKQRLSIDMYNYAQKVKQNEKNLLVLPSIIEGMKKNVNSCEALVCSHLEEEKKRPLKQKLLKELKQIDEEISISFLNTKHSSQQQQQTAKCKQEIIIMQHQQQSMQQQQQQIEKKKKNSLLQMINGAIENREKGRQVSQSLDQELDRLTVLTSKNEQARLNLLEVQRFKQILEAQVRNIEEKHKKNLQAQYNYYQKPLKIEDQVLKPRINNGQHPINSHNI